MWPAVLYVVGLCMAVYLTVDPLDLTLGSGVSQPTPAQRAPSPGLVCTSTFCSCLSFLILKKYIFVKFLLLAESSGLKYFVIFPKPI